jgi:predicted nucleic acid-binding protein
MDAAMPIAAPDFPLPLHSTRSTDPVREGRPPRVVLETSIVLSALMFGGPTATRLRRAWRHGFCRPMVDDRTLMDLRHQIAATSLGLSLVEQQKMMGEYLPYVLRVQAREGGGGGSGSPEPAGLLFVQLALAGQAHLLISSDASLLAMGDRLPFQVLALEPFLDWLRQSPIDPVPLRHPSRRR